MTENIRSQPILHFRIRPTAVIPYVSKNVDLIEIRQAAVCLFQSFVDAKNINIDPIFLRRLSDESGNIWLTFDRLLYNNVGISQGEQFGIVPNLLTNSIL